MNLLDTIDWYFDMCEQTDCKWSPPFWIQELLSGVTPDVLEREYHLREDARAEQLSEMRALVYGYGW